MPDHNLPTVAFLGLGIMGLPMAKRLANAGFPVRAWNRSRARANELQHPRATICATASDAVKDAEVVIVMLSSGPVVDEVLFTADESGPAPAEIIAPGSMVIVMSSIPVETSQAQARRLSEKGVRYLDAPVSGGERGAMDGSLTIMAGGDTQDFDRAAPVFAPLGRAVHVGPVGSGQLAKLANQLIVGVTIGAVSEAMILAEAGGADPAAVRDALLGGFADSTILRQHGERIITRNFTPGGHATTQLKDLTTAADHAATLGRSLPFLNLCRDEFDAMCRNDMGDHDHSALYLALERKSQIRD